MKTIKHSIKCPSCKHELAVKYYEQYPYCCYCGAIQKPVDNQVKKEQK